MYTMIITAGFNAVTTFLSSGSLEILWTMMNTLQLMDYIPALNLNYPPNLISTFGYLNIANGNTQTTQDYYNWAMNINSDTWINDGSVNDNFASQGLSSLYFFNNSENQIIILNIFILAWPVILFFKNVMGKCFAVKRFFKGFETGMFFNGLIRFYLECFLDF